MNRKIIISLLLSTLTITSFGERTFQLRGIVFCASSPATNLMVKIYDKPIDSESLPNELNRTTTDSSGYFTLEATTDDDTPLEPFVNIWHNCFESVMKGCDRVLRVKIPKNYITQDKENVNTFDLGKINLESRFEHIRECECEEKYFKSTTLVCNITEKNIEIAKITEKISSRICIFWNSKDEGKEKAEQLLFKSVTSAFYLLSSLTEDALTCCLPPAVAEHPNT
ncbi:Transthyretin-like protein 46 [Trichinella spiralis]|uniref:Transthyretin-like protein 46 n=1 Tax=Trichinella spiralis TaxID=6334 RepID=A0A0V1BMK3_TRISP|nr:Transthyretin-like protein 46 [Trichinella spiralis]